MIVAEVLSLVQGMGMDLDKETEALEYGRMSVDIIFTLFLHFMGVQRQADENLCKVWDPLKVHPAVIGKCVGSHSWLPWGWTLVGNSCHNMRV